MGASDSKLSFKQGVFKLSEQKDIRADDTYWTGFWELPESVEDVFSLFSSADIRRIRDESQGNLETLILAVTSRLFVLRNNKSFPNPETAPASDALNCIRVITRLLPFIYEAERLESWEEQFFWTPRRKRNRTGPQQDGEVLFEGDNNQEQRRQDEVPEFSEVKPLAEELIDTLLDLLFFSNFTLPRVPNTEGQVHLAIWQSGVGCHTPIGTSKEFENNRMEILRLLLTLASKSMYTSASVLPIQGVKAVTYMTTNPNKQLVLTLLCSLLNTTLKYNPTTWHVPYDHVVLKDPKQTCVTYCLQLLLVMVMYPVPETSDGLPPKNNFRHFLGKLHRPQDFQFLVDGMTRVLNQPLQATSSYLPGSQKSLAWAPEMIVLFWEVLQCNKRFRSFIIDTDRAHDFVVLILFYALHHKNDQPQHGIVRMSVFVLQTLSVEPAFGLRLNKTFTGQDALPQSIRIPNFRGSYTDFLVIAIHSLITTSNGKLDAIYPALLAIINNIAPHASDLSSTSSVKLMQLYTLMSSSDFLFANESNHELLQSLLEAFNAIVENQYEKNAAFVYAILRSQKRFFALRDIVVNGAEDQLERFARRRKELAELPRPPDNMMRSPTTARAPSLSDVPETRDAFAIGDDEDDDESDSQAGATPNRSSSQTEEVSRGASRTSSIDEAVPSQLRGMSEKARGKMPAGHKTFSRHSSTASLGNLAMGLSLSNGSFEPSTAWVESWLPELPLHTILTLIEQLEPHLPPQGPSSTSGPSLNVIRRTQIQGLERSSMRVHLFEWSPLSLGWYESLLWGFIFSSEVTMFKGNTGIWKGTSIRLFRVQETAAQGPSLMAPRGAVDAVGTSLVERIGSLNLRGNSNPVPQQNHRGGIVRDV